MGDETKAFVNLEPVEAFEVTIQPRVLPEISLGRVTPYQVVGQRFEASMTVTVEDPDAYQRMLSESNTFTVEQRVDLNPHHRTARGFRARLRRARSITYWHWRKLIRKRLPETAVVTIPDVKAEHITITGPSG